MSVAGRPVSVDPRRTGGSGSGGSSTLADRFAEHWWKEQWTGPGDRVVVACSGGLDSLVLLHLLRFSPPTSALVVEAAHFDHRMRLESRAEAEWLSGVCGAWRVLLRQGVAEKPPGDEAGARTLRYRFLKASLRESGARWLLTAHHADDQIETLLFRIVRGTGVEGLRGIPEVRAPGILRPLLPFARIDLEKYASEHHLRPRVDPTNLSPRFARNRVRNEIVPLLERIHPGARESLLRLARNAERTVDALERLLAPHLERVVLERDAGGIVLDRALLAAYPESVRSELLRAVADTLDVRLDETGTALAVQFITTGSSGSRLDLGGGLRLQRDFDRLRLSLVGRDAGSAQARGSADPDLDETPLTIESPDEGRGRIDLEGHAFAVRWKPTGVRESFDEGQGWHRAEFARHELLFPVCVRGWRPGDRVRRPGGRRRKLKKVFAEMHVPREDRSRTPVLVDAEGLVVWVAAGGRESASMKEEEPRWTLGIKAVDDT